MSGPSLSSTREAFIAGLLELAERDPAVVLVCADSVKAMRAQEFASRHPRRIFDLGIAEANAVGFAAGLASSGLKPWVGTYAGFLTMRACEQLRTYVAYPGLNVKFVGANGGIAAGEREGVTHQFFEDLGILRCIPGFTVTAPADAGQTRKATLALAARDGPGYLRVGSGRDPVILDDGMDFRLDRARILAEHGTDCALFACGSILGRALEASEILRAEGVGTLVVEVHTLKPLDTETVVDALRRTGAGVTVEDHNIIGGLGSAVAEAAAEGCPAPLERIGVRDVFPESGEGPELLDRHGMSVADIAAAVRHVVARKAAGGRA